MINKLKIKFSKYFIQEKGQVRQAHLTMPSSCVRLGPAPPATVITIVFNQFQRLSFGDVFAGFARNVVQVTVAVLFGNAVDLFAAVVNQVTKPENDQ